MSLQHEVLFRRLLPRYERRFGQPPPFVAADLETAVTFMRAAMESANEVVTKRPTLPGTLEPAGADS